MQTKFFESAYRFVDDAIAAGQANPVAKEMLEGSLDNREFVGRRFTDWESIQKAATSTWKDGAKIVLELLGRIDSDRLPKLKSVKRVQAWSDDGDDFSQDREDRGLPAWRGTRRRQRVRITTVKIIIDVTAPCTRDAEEIFWRGAAALAATKLLEQAGYRVELQTAEHTEGANRYDHGEHHVTFVQTKAASDPLDIDTLATCCAGWFYRTVHFSAASLYGTPEVGLGSARPIPPQPNAYVVQQVWNAEQAIEWITRTLNTIAK